MSRADVKIQRHLKWRARWGTGGGREKQTDKTNVCHNNGLKRADVSVTLTDRLTSTRLHAGSRIIKQRCERIHYKRDPLHPGAETQRRFRHVQMRQKRWSSLCPGRCQTKIQEIMTAWFNQNAIGRSLKIRWKENYHQIKTNTNK